MGKVGRTEGHHKNSPTEVAEQGDPACHWEEEEEEELEEEDRRKQEEVVFTLKILPAQLQMVSETAPLQTKRPVDYTGAVIVTLTLLERTLTATSLSLPASFSRQQYTSPNPPLPTLCPPSSNSFSLKLPVADASTEYETCSTLSSEERSQVAWSEGLPAYRDSTHTTSV